jgi:Short repeat of unknown function (DUF308)
MAGGLLCNTVAGDVFQRADDGQQRDNRAISGEAIMTMYQPPELNETAQRVVVSAIHAHWVLFLVEGIVLVLLGAAAIIVPVVATLAFTLVIGWLFLISGIVGLVTTFWMRGVPGFWWALLSAIIAIAAGVVLLLWPISGTLSLTLVLIAFKDEAPRTSLSCRSKPNLGHRNVAHR